MQDYYGQNALLDRLTNGVKQSGKSVVFLLGSALTAPTAHGEPGIPGVNGVIQLILAEFPESQQVELQTILDSSHNPYQEAFHFYLGRRGQQMANGIVRAAVANARIRPISVNSNPNYTLSTETTDDACRLFENDKSGWFLTPAARSFGELAAKYPDRFGRTVLTTNFDPLIAAATAVAGRTSFRTVLHGDGNFVQTDGDGLHVIHLHGYWYGSDTLHTPRQLNQPRPSLKSSLLHLLRDKIVVVMGYGGWDDVFMQALIDVIVDDNAYPEVIWTFNNAKNHAPTRLLKLLDAGLARGRVSLYDGIDCHKFLPDLVTAWEQIEPCQKQPPPENDNVFVVTRRSEPWRSPKTLPQWIVKEEDSPPAIEFFVGRQQDYERISSSNYRIAFVTGMGGQGKSALAAKYFAQATLTKLFEHSLWRDCREVSEKFEDQIATIVESLNGGKTTSNEISKQSIEDIADLFCLLTTELPLLIIFDNVDHYVDLEANMMGGAPGRFIQRFMQNKSAARLIFTCRPQINHTSKDAISIRLSGLQLEDVNILLDHRGAKLDAATVTELHEHTAGHAFWIDLLAAQIANNRINESQLQSLLSSSTANNFGIPDNTLNSIWRGLPEREQVVLQVLAEVIRPTSDLELSSYLDSRLRFNQMSKALKSLRDQNLVVVKLNEVGVEGLELHPLIRTFIRQTFPIVTRKSFIDLIFSVYLAYFGSHRKVLGNRPARPILTHWLEGAELCINSGEYDKACNVLSDVTQSFSTTEPPGEFVRLADLLFKAAGIKELRRHIDFDKVFGCYIRLVSRLGRTETASDALSEYHETLEVKDARYILYCEMRAHLHWTNGDYPAAIKWGTEGVKLKSESGVDTRYTTEHTLALAQRDSGAIDSALQFFLRGTELDTVANSSLIEADRGGEFYGNIGRCLHLMGQIEPALSCYRKSAKLIEDSTKGLENQAFIRQWIGELLFNQGLKNESHCFLTAAIEKWKEVSPPKQEKLSIFVTKAFGSDNSFLDPLEAEAYCQNWIESNQAPLLKLTAAG